MDQLFDSLSEDWVSQPRSPLSEEGKRSPSAVNSPSQLSNASQSRIPRFASRSVSGRPTNGTTTGRQTSSIASNDSTKQPLREKTPSNLNSFNNKPLRKSSGKPIGASPKVKAAGKESSPRKTSSPSLPQDTVQHKVSPVKQPAAEGTPDWKRRLGNKTTSGDQPDLFSPIGLQNVFRPPTLKGKGAEKKGRKYKPSATEEAPSSPSSIPTQLRRSSVTPGRDSVRKDPRTLGSLDEASEASFNQPDQQGGRDVHDATISEERSGSTQKSKSQPRREDGKRDAFSEQRTVDDPEPNQLERWREDSNVSHTMAPSERSRVASGQTEDCNEGLSPCYVSRQQTVDGRIDYAAIVSSEDIRERLNDLKQRIKRPSSRSSDRDVSYVNTTPPRASISQQYPSSELTSHSLPEDLSTGTASFMANGGFINPRRGGFSQESSFLRRPLSPSSSVYNQTRMSSIATAVRRNSTGSSARNTPARHEQPLLPSTPKSRQAQRSSSSERPRSSGSPLKLFGQYDTFTNDRLARHMSRFEQTMPDSLEADEMGDDGPRRASQHSQRKTSRLSSFGEGQLDNHRFDTHRPLPPPKASYEVPSSELRSHESREFRFNQNDDDMYDSIPKRKRKNRPSTSRAVSEASHRNQEQEEGDSHLFQEVDNVARTASGKRLPQSPAKYPQPKRRRTLLESELTIEFLASPAKVDITEVLVKSVVGRKRKDALYDNNTQQADPNVLANRHILRPRNPTPSQSGLHESRGLRFTTRREAGASDYYTDSAHQQEESQLAVDPSTEKLAEELASLAQNVAQDMSDGVRKPSVTTADFFNEAQQIMQLIRTRGRPPSSHISEEPDPEENFEDDYDSRLLESTRDEFSRPPSREGGSLRRVRGQAQIDARVVSQLRRYEDDDDVGMAFSSSLKSLKVVQTADSQLAEEVRHAMGQHDAELQSDSNVRILDSATRRHQRNKSSASEMPTTSTAGHSQSYGSHSTSDPSTGRSVPTNSSRGSRNKAMIAPETVAHLLSDQVAGMTFDHERQVWVKSRTSSKSESASKMGSASSEMTDDDLLDAIPDLSVDELEEMKRVKVADRASTRLASVPERVSHQDHAHPTPEIKAPANGESRPQPADGRQTGPDDLSSAPSKCSRFASSGTVSETRATSWGDEAFSHKPSEKGITTYPSQNVQPAHRLEEVEHEISILEGRISQTPQRKGYRQPRVVTVAFSSPLVDQIEGSYLHQEPEEAYDEPIPFETPRGQASERRVSSSTKKVSVGFRRGTGHRVSSRRASQAQPSYVSRPMSRLDEHEELSIVRCSRGASIDVVLSTPLNKHSLAVPTTSGQISSIGFQLSPLTEFTVHQVDRPLDRPMITNRQEAHSLQPSQMQVSLSAQEIVKKITDVEPYEPYWEYLHTLDLCDRGVQTLHLLNDFCARLQELEVSKNQLVEVNGAPSSLRSLHVRRNCLSNLTAWGHLYNLQYLDVSHNQLTNLRGFQSLVHLRELKADDNQIEHLEGVFGLDGLIKLSVKRNRIRWVDFEGADL